MEYQIEQASEILRNTPHVLRAMLTDVCGPWVTNDYGADTFSPFDVVGHLIHGEETDWIPRALMILEHGESRAFEPFDRYAMYSRSKGKTIRELLDEFERQRCTSLEALCRMNLTGAHLDRRGKHSALGSVTMRELLATWVVHDLNHIAQICKAMAFQYRDQVGPWRAYLSILKPPSPAQ
ncbi:MAG: DinB family protein [Planctomycetes bacterium]|nr:DinB family protein [Planctomycetota bacterium]MBI3834444.1 DinB family protein [Planctomycetota bacterium]